VTSPGTGTILIAVIGIQALECHSFFKILRYQLFDVLFFSAVLAVW
jgi:hypothetical protein